MKIQPIVEGHGDVAALPVLLRRLVNEAQVWGVDIGRPIRRPRNRLVEEAGVQQAVQLALVQPDCGGVLVLLDGDSDCPAHLGPTVLGWATEAAAEVPCGVVLAHREYEAWFLAAIESLRGYRSVRIDAEPHADPERPRGAKAQTGGSDGAGRELCGDLRPTRFQREVFADGGLPAVALVSEARGFVRNTGSQHGP